MNVSRRDEPAGSTAGVTAIELSWSQANRNTTKMKWEYRTVMFEASRWFLGGKIDGSEFNDRLNQLGEEGWELVNVFDTNFANGGTREAVAVFKRPMQ
jgi:hypothetical protein